MINDESNLFINITKSLTNKWIDTALECIFGTEMMFEKGRQNRNPNRSKVG